VVASACRVICDQKESQKLAGEAKEVFRPASVGGLFHSRPHQAATAPSPTIIPGFSLNLGTAFADISLLGI